MELALETLDGGRTDRVVFSVMQIPGNPLRAKRQLFLDDDFGAPNGLWYQTTCQMSRWCAFAETHEPRGRCTR